jgi:hypothetical protein
MVGLVVNNELKRIWKEAVLAYSRCNPGTAWKDSANKRTQDILCVRYKLSTF